MTQATTQPSLRRRAAGLRLTRLGVSRERFTPHRVVVLAILAFALGFYLWTASQASFVFTGPSADPYNLLTTAFLHGHTYLPVTVPPGLLHLANPYDPAQNAPYQTAFHDLALRNGHLYSPWGPTPVFALFMPFRLTGLIMPQSLAAVLFAFAGLVCAVKLMHVLIRRFVPDTPDWLLSVATVGLVLTNVVPFILRRPAQYEVAISAGLCFEMAGILLLLTAAMGDSSRRGRLAWGSLCLGLAIGCRPTLAVGGGLALVVAFYLMRWRGSGRRVLVPALAPFLICGVLLAAYNDVRFGSPAEFGQRYQLAGLDVTHKPTDQFAYVPPGLFSYLLVPPRLAITFPHVFLMTANQYPGSLPSGYSGTPVGGPAEPAGGLLPTMPISFALFALPLLWRRRRAGEAPILVIAAGLTVMGLAVIGLLSYALWGTTQRYEVDYATLLLLASFIVWAVLITRQLAGRRAIAAGGIVLTVVGAIIGAATSLTGYYNVLPLTDPGVFNRLEDITSPLATLATMVAGHPVVARVDDVVPVDIPPPGYGTLSQRGAGAWLGGQGAGVTLVAPTDERKQLVAQPIRGPGVSARLPLFVRAGMGGQTSTVVPVGTGLLRIPIKLHRGINRITLSLVPKDSTAPEQLYLQHIDIGG